MDVREKLKKLDIRRSDYPGLDIRRPGDREIMDPGLSIKLKLVI
jgi:hypothetical protein